MRTSVTLAQKQLLEKSIDKEKLRAMRAEVSWYHEYVDGTELLYQEAFAIEKRKVATLSTQVNLACNTET